MTTVINFNILNFFQLKLNNYTVNDVRINNNFHDRKNDESQGNDRVIDVTPYNKTFDGNGDLMLRDIPVPDKKVPHMQLAMDPASVCNTYDRSGNAIQIYHSKGMLIDSYA
jgi:hypothetical protein